MPPCSLGPSLMACCPKLAGGREVPSALAWAMKVHAQRSAFRLWHAWGTRALQTFLAANIRAGMPGSMSCLAHEIPRGSKSDGPNVSWSMLFLLPWKSCHLQLCQGQHVTHGEVVVELVPGGRLCRLESKRGRGVERAAFRQYHSTRAVAGMQPQIGVIPSCAGHLKLFDCWRKSRTEAACAATACGQQPAALQQTSAGKSASSDLQSLFEQPSKLAGSRLTLQISPRLDTWSRVARHVVCGWLPCQVAG